MSEHEQTGEIGSWDAYEGPDIDFEEWGFGQLFLDYEPEEVRRFQFFPGTYVLTPIAQPLGAILALRSLGDPVRLDRITEAIEQLVSITTAPAPGRYSDEEVAAYYRKRAGRARLAEQILAEQGYRFDHETGKVHPLEGGAPGRPPRFLTIAAGILWEYLEPLYREATEDATYVPKRLRKVIARELSAYFPPSQLAIGHNDPLTRALRDYRKAPDRYAP